MGPVFLLALGCHNVGFGRSLGGNFNGNDNNNVGIGVSLYYFSLLGQIKSSSGTSNSLVLLQDLCEYNDDSDAFRLDPNADCGSDPPKIG